MKYLSVVFLLVLVIPALAKPTEGGLISPLDNKTEVSTPLPADRKFKNMGGSDGAGLCVFASITYCARYQGEHRLYDFFTKMRKEPGGGWPEKVDKMIAKYAPGVQYIQDTTGNVELLKLAIRTGRPVGVTYAGMDSHYGERTGIDHMVQLVYIDNQCACISDNNFPGDNQYMWMSLEDFTMRWKARGGGWCVILLAPPPPPPPHNLP